MGHPPTLRQLRELSDDELIDRFDESAQRTSVGVVFYREELRAREAARQTETITRLTWWIAGMTLVVTVATIVNLYILLSG